MMRAALNLIAFGLVLAAAVSHFGLLEGLGVAAAVWVLTPYTP